MLSLSRMGNEAEAAAYYTSASQEAREANTGWFGAGAATLGLRGPVETTEFQRVFEGFHPFRNEALVRNAGSPRHRPGLDACVSADKSVSTLWAVASSQTRRKIEACQQTAVEKLTQEIEQKYAWTRTGAGGQEWQPVQVVAAGFLHRASRNLDPQLHTHLCLLNAGVRQDGLTSALVTRPLYRAKHTLGGLYRVELALQLAYQLGLEPVWNGPYFYLHGVPDALQDAFSSRRQDILAALEAKGLSSPQAAAVNCLATRPDKHEPEAHLLFGAWKETGQQYEFGGEEAESLPGRYVPDQPIETLRSQWQQQMQEQRELAQERPMLAEPEHHSTALHLSLEDQEHEML